MKILIVNPPHLSIGSRIPQEQLPSLGLLCLYILGISLVYFCLQGNSSGFLLG